MRAMLQGALAGRSDSPEVFVINPFRGGAGHKEKTGYTEMFPHLAESSGIVAKEFSTAMKDGDVEKILTPQQGQQTVVPKPFDSEETGGSGTICTIG